MKQAVPFATEKELVSAFLEWLTAAGPEWVAYPETAGWDLLLVHRENGLQLGIEAKLALNAKVLCQALDGSNSIWNTVGPDFRAALVPLAGLQLHFGAICQHLGLAVLALQARAPGSCGGGRWSLSQPLPNRNGETYGGWWPWCPERRCALPDYRPDVVGGVPAPVQLTDWKIQAIKLLIILDRRGVVDRSHLRALRLSPTRWTARNHGYLTPGRGGYVRCDRTPDLKKIHPVNYAEIEADFDKWSDSVPGLQGTSAQDVGD